MIKLFRYFFMFALLSCQSFSKLDKSPSSIQEKKLSGFLWKAEKQGKTIYFLGTFHIPGLSLSNLPKEVSQYIKSSNIFFVESDKSKLNDTVTSVDSSAKNLSKESWDKLTDFYRWQLSIAGLKETQINQSLPKAIKELKLQTPFEIFMSIELGALSIALQHFFNLTDKEVISLFSQETLDQNLLNYAKSIPGLKMSFLEDPNLVMDIINKAHSPKDIDILLKNYQTIQDLLQERGKRNYAQFICYEKGDLDCLKKELLAERSSLAEGWQETLVQRNKNWIPVIEKSLESGNSFIATGASHFVGKDNVLDLLKDRGFKVERLLIQK